MFNVGDRVKSQYTDNMGEVVFGPFDPAADHIGGPSYLVKLLEGQKAGLVAIWPAAVTRLAPRFEVGQVVRARYLTSGLTKVAAGPFKGERCQWYVLELPDGRHRMEFEGDITPVVE